MQELLHRTVERGELIAEVQQLNTVRVELSVSEKELDDVQTGQRVDLRVLACPNLRLSGEVTAISPAAASADSEFTASSQFIVTTEIENKSRQLKPGMTGKAQIRCRQSHVMDVVARKLSQYASVEFWSWW